MSFKGSAAQAFTCASCGRPGKKIFTRAASALQSAEVAARAALARFLRHPLCQDCEPAPGSSRARRVQMVREGLNISVD